MIPNITYLFRTFYKAQQFVFLLHYIVFYYDNVFEYIYGKNSTIRSDVCSRSTFSSKICSCSFPFVLLLTLSFQYQQCSKNVVFCSLNMVICKWIILNIMHDLFAFTLITMCPQNRLLDRQYSMCCSFN